MRGQLRRHVWSCPQLQRIGACRRTPDLLPDADAAATVAEAAAADAAEPASNALPATALPAEAAPQLVMEAAAGLLTVLAAAVAERCLLADEPATDRRAAELQAACNPGSLLWPSFRDGSSKAPAHQASAAVPPPATTAGQDGWTACKNARHGQAEPVAAATCGITAPAPVLVLFSGGVDSTLLAALAHQVHPPAKAACISHMCLYSPLYCRLCSIMHSIRCTSQVV